MLATFIVAGVLALCLYATEKGSFRLAAIDHFDHCSIQLFSLRDITFRDRRILSYHQDMAWMLNRVADLRGEPQTFDPFPEKSFEEIAKAMNDSPWCVFPPSHHPGRSD
jgi:hypothetical protein